MAEYGRLSKLWFIYLFGVCGCVAAVAMTFLIMKWTDLIIPCFFGSKLDPAVQS